MDRRQFYSDYIFYLKLKDSLPSSYYLFSEQLSKWDITLIPIGISDINDIKEGGKLPHILAVISDIDSSLHYKKLQQDILDFSLKTRRVFLYDLNSFGPIKIFSSIARFNNYLHFDLPVDISETCKRIAEFYYQTDKENTTWPGGRRAKLPSMNA